MLLTNRSSRRIPDYESELELSVLCACFVHACRQLTAGRLVTNQVTKHTTEDDDIFKKIFPAQWLSIKIMSSKI